MTSAEFADHMFSTSFSPIYEYVNTDIMASISELATIGLYMLFQRRYAYVSYAMQLRYLRTVTT